MLFDPTLSVSRLKPYTYTKIFVSFDLLSLILQAAGGAIASISNTKSTTDLGVNVLIAGLAFQVFSLVVFMALCTDFAVRVRKAGLHRPGGAGSSYMPASDMKGSRRVNGLLIGMFQFQHRRESFH